MRLAILLLPFLQLSLAATYTLQHRLLTSANPSQWDVYGTLDLSSGRISQSGTASIHTSEEGWYQVLLTGEDLGEGVMTSTKACYLYGGSPSLVINSYNDRVNGIDIVPHSSIPADGSCPPPPASDHPASLNDQAIFKHPTLIFGPDLAPPIPVSSTPDGKPVAPPEEKSFLGKYWLPLLGLGFFVVSQLAPDDKAQQAAPAKP